MVKNQFSKKRILFIYLLIFSLSLSGIFFAKINKNLRAEEKKDQGSTQITLPDGTSVNEKGNIVDTSSSQKNMEAYNKSTGTERTSASGILFDFALETMAKGVGYLMLFIFKILSSFVFLAGQIVDATFKIEQFRNIPIVEIGWNITRGLCNMFFAVYCLLCLLRQFYKLKNTELKDCFGN